MRKGACGVPTRFVALLNASQPNSDVDSVTPGAPARGFVASKPVRHQIEELLMTVYWPGVSMI
jgi:hypothetical protein